LGLSVGLIALSTLNYGFDNQGIATSQAMVPYKKQFGDYDAKTKTYAIPSYFLSLLNSLNFIGFAFGTPDKFLMPSRSG
jgi:MFS transporter, SP family, sugar:H+ symporter